MPEENVSFNPKKVGALVSLVVLLVGAGWSTFGAINNTHAKFATKVEVAQEISNVQGEILQVAIMGYEDELMSLNFKISTGQASDLDAAVKENIQSRLVDLKAKLNNL